MRDNDIHKLIESQEPEKKAALFEEFQRRNSDVFEQKQVKKVKFNYRWLSLIATAACAVLCLIIALPFLLKSGILPPGNNPSISDGDDIVGVPPHNPPSSVRYFAAADCVANVMNCNLGEYASRFDKPLLHIDMYDGASEVNTTMYVNNNDHADIVYLYEQIISPGKKETVDLYITDKDTHVDILTEIEKKCVGKCIINNVDVNWFDRKSEHLAAFEYKDNKYYVSLERNLSTGEADPYILSFVMSMLFSDYRQF